MKKVLFICFISEAITLSACLPATTSSAYHEGVAEDDERALLTACSAWSHHEGVAEDDERAPKEVTSSTRVLSGSGQSRPTVCSSMSSLEFYGTAAIAHNLSLHTLPHQHYLCPLLLACIFTRRCTPTKAGKQPGLETSKWASANQQLQMMAAAAPGSSLPAGQEAITPQTQERRNRS
ncbi:hypothetical protein E2P81_ATG03834 [Venturia nashicola]|nr:hypothetical protein E2P81_ATG03834 [Venturia nashicola]